METNPINLIGLERRTLVPWVAGLPADAAVARMARRPGRLHDVRRGFDDVDESFDAAASRRFKSAFSASRAAIRRSRRSMISTNCSRERFSRPPTQNLSTSTGRSLNLL
jgi:hypothetical protein